MKADQRKSSRGDPRRARRVARTVEPIVGAALLCVACPAGAENWFPVRTHNPFLQIYGVPAFQGADVLSPGRSDWRFTFDIANHADDSATSTESITLDGESYFLNFAARRGMTPWLELGIDVPVVAHADGMLDNVIEGWHDLWGMSNANRTGPPNELEFVYANPAIDDYALYSGGAGLGDVRLHAAVPLRFAALPPTAALTVKAGLKLPTGDAKALRGSGAADVSLAVYWSDTEAFGIDRLDVTAHAGVLAAGDGDLFGEIQESTVPFGGFAADWRFNERLRAMAALYAQGRFVESDLDELGTSLQLIVGGEYRFAGGYTLSFGIVEELFSDATVDFAVQFSLRRGLGSDG
ncbi:MAG TPA: DUF3187 family protein [Woeseiaceae bacterium]|nr:DUF3187 family protein [Woeseiaceae bacterium]